MRSIPSTESMKSMKSMKSINQHSKDTLTQEFTTGREESGRIQTILMDLYDATFANSIFKFADQFVKLRM